MRMEPEWAGSGGAGRDGVGGAEGRGLGATVIDCDECVLQHTDACTDCLVTFICGREAGEAVVIDVGEARAVRSLTRAGLVPGLRHVRRTG
jgi:hypothetical protein